MNLRKWNVKIIGYSLLVLFLGYYISITQFTHTHMINGITIAHSHPYNSAKDTPINHQHTSGELFLIQVLSHFITSGIILFAAIAAIQVLLQILKLNRQKNHYFSKSFSLFLQRGPPINIHN